MNAKINVFAQSFWKVLAAVLIAVLILTPTVAADEISLAAPNHLITFVGVEQVHNGWRWTYEIVSAGPHAISHVDFELCVPQGAFVEGYDPAGDDIEWEHGILKFDNEYDDYETRQVWFTLSSYYPAGDVDATIKAATEFLPRTVTGPVCEPVYGEVGDFVWFDYNGNGVYDGSDYGIDGVLIELYHDLNGNDIPEAGELIDTTTTSNGGYYLFSGLTVDADGELYITVVAASNFGLGGALWSYSQTYDNSGPLDNTSKSVALTSNGPFSDLTLDFAYSVAPEAVQLASFGAEPAQGGVLIKWETGSEINNLGFNIYRNTGDNVQAGSVMVNPQFIPSQSFGNLFGASYEYLDTTAEPGVFYHYWLEDVEAVGQAKVADLFLMGVHYIGRARWSMPEATGVNAGQGPINHKDAIRLVGLYRDLDQDLSAMYMLINDSPVAQGGVLVRYDAVNNLFSLFDETSNTWLSGVAPREAKSLIGTYASLRGLKSNVFERKEGRVLKVVYRVKFKPDFIGTYNIYTMAEDLNGNSSGWQFQQSVTIQ